MIKTETIKECDICKTQRSSLKEYHWSDTVEHIMLSFKSHSGVQEIPFDGEICTDCGKKLAKLIRDFVNNKTPHNP